MIETVTEINGMLLVSVEMTDVGKTGGTFGWCWYCQIQIVAVGKKTVADKNALV